VQVRSCRITDPCDEAASIALPEHLRQPGDVDGDAPRLVLRQDLSLPRLTIVVAAVEVGERLPAGVPNDVTARYLVGVPGRWETAGWFGHGDSLSRAGPTARLARRATSGRLRPISLMDGRRSARGGRGG
jgi:hypothetical protein